TYASIIGTILNRGYVYKKGSALVPAWIAFSVVRLLEEHFARQIDYEFTAMMEDVLDDIAGGRKNLETELGEFYFGSDKIEGLKRLVTELGDIDAKELATFPVLTPAGEVSGIDLRVGRYGPYVEVVKPEGKDDEGDGDATPARANVPDDLPPDELTEAKALELLANPAGVEQELGRDPESGNMIVAKNGRFGPYVTEVLPEDAPKKQKARTGSLFKTMTLETVNLEDALRLLSLPRVVGVDAEGVEITAQNGRYGPYLKKGTDSRSLTTEEELFEITVEQALAIYAQPKQRGRGAAVAPLKELGNDPVSGQPVVVKAGRFGEYVTDGEYNATLRKDDSVEEITLERAAELLAERREKGPAKKAAKKGAKKSAAKKTTKKAAKKTTKKAAAKKA
ncbi:MAG: topoisomerase C-terminal repeat-containing protein, partial [Marmoricola sp.]